MAESRAINVDRLDHLDVRRFVEAAEKVCDVFEHMDDLSEMEFLVELKDRLSLAYSLAHRLPNPYDSSDDDDEGTEENGESVESRLQPQGMSEAENMERWKDLYYRIGQKLGTHSHVAFVFDPTNPDERKVVDGELAEMLAGLYLDLKCGLILYHRPSDGERAKGLWDLRFGMTHGWGSRFAAAFLPIHSLLDHHYDAIGERWWADYQDEESTA